LIEIQIKIITITIIIIISIIIIIIIIRIIIIIILIVYQIKNMNQLNKNLLINIRRVYRSNRNIYNNEWILNYLGNFKNKFAK
jgi:hypothetical protein